MAEHRQLNTVNRLASVESVDRALNLLKNRVPKSSRRKLNEQTRGKAVHSQCVMNFIPTPRKLIAGSAFTHTHVVIEMRNALINEDWSALQKMFPQLLKCLHIQNIVWRYAFLIYLLCPYADLSCFQEFLSMTIGENYIDNEFYLENLMTLHPEIRPDNQ